MLNKMIEATFEHSPKHRTRLYTALCNVAKFDYVTAGYICGQTCRKLDIPDYPNPFPADFEAGIPRAQWAGGFVPGYAGQARPAPAPVPVKKSKARRLGVEPVETLRRGAEPEPTDLPAPDPMKAAAPYEISREIGEVLFHGEAKPVEENVVAKPRRVRKPKAAAAVRKPRKK